MVGSGCDVLRTDPERFVNYILNDRRMRNQIYDEDSLEKVARKVLVSDDSMNNIIKDIDSSGDDLSSCLDGVYTSPEIQRIVSNNIRTKRRELSKRVRVEKPRLKGSKLRAEIDKRMKQSIGVSKSQIAKTKQVTIFESLKNVKIKDYKRTGKVVAGYSKTSNRDLSKAELMLIKNNLDKRPPEVYEIYMKSGLTFRTRESIRKHYYRLKRKLKK